MSPILSWTHQAGPLQDFASILLSVVELELVLLCHCIQLFYQISSVTSELNLIYVQASSFEHLHIVVMEIRNNNCILESLEYKGLLFPSVTSYLREITCEGYCMVSQFSSYDGRLTAQKGHDSL